MTPKSTTGYETPGGKSELRIYEDREGLTVELHDNSFFVGWSAVVAANEFMRSVEALTTASAADQARLLPPLNGRLDHSFQEALEQVTVQPDGFAFIRVRGAGDAFTWETSRGREASSGGYPHAPGEVGIVCSVFRRAPIATLIEETATPNVKADLPAILDSTERLAARFLPASA